MMRTPDSQAQPEESAVQETSGPELPAELKTTMEDYLVHLQGRESGQKAGQSTVDTKRCALQFTLKYIDQMSRWGQKGGVIDNMVTNLTDPMSKELVKGKIKARSLKTYLHVLRDFLKWIGASDRARQRLRVTGDRARNLAESCGRWIESLMPEVSLCFFDAFYALPISNDSKIAESLIIRVHFRLTVRLQQKKESSWCAHGCKSSLANAAHPNRPSS